MKSINLTINYKTGTKIEQVVNYVHFENGKIIFTLKNQTNYSVIGQQVSIPLENIESFDIEETEQAFNGVI